MLLAIDAYDQPRQAWSLYGIRNHPWHQSISYNSPADWRASNSKTRRVGFKRLIYCQRIGLEYALTTTNTSSIVKSDHPGNKRIRGSAYILHDQSNKGYR